MSEKEQYLVLDDSVASRDFKILFQFTTSNFKPVSDQSYRALYNTSGNMDQLVDWAIERRNPLAMFALRGHPLEAKHLSSLISYYSVFEDSLKTEVIKTLGERADWSTHLWLFEKWQKTFDKPTEKAFALAISRSSLTYPIPDSLLNLWVERAISQTDNKLISYYLYGAYRSSKPIITEKYSNQLFSFFDDNFENLNTLNKQYLIQILAKVKAPQLLDWMSSYSFPTSEINLQVEIIKALNKYPFSPKYQQTAQLFLSTSNESALQTFFESISPDQSWNPTLKPALIAVQKRFSNPYHPIRLSAQVFEEKAFKKGANFTISNLKEVLQTQPYSLNQAFSLAEMSLTKEQIINTIETNWNEISNASKLVASEYWASKIIQLPESEVSNHQIFLKNLLNSTDRGILIGISGVFNNEQLMRLFSLDEFVTHLLTLDYEQDIEVFQTYIPILKNIKTENTLNFFNKLGSSSNPTLQKTLQDSGFPPLVKSKTVWRAVPNRERLAELGDNPTWTLETNKGIITLELDAVRAPTTVWLIDSLSNSGKFDNVAFHRVIGNFVMQGGDFETGNGYGGGNTIIPTEASELEFDRGAVGMASAGTDTESAQYFIMHQWQPHLNGRYTRFGAVISGMDVVDNIIVGDKVIHANVMASN